MGEGRGVRAHVKGSTYMEKITLAYITTLAASLADADDTHAQAVEDGLRSLGNALVQYVPQSDKPLDSAEFKAAADSVKAVFRSKYLNRQRYAGKGADRRPVNMAMAKTVSDMPESEREKLAKDAPERKVWDGILAYARQNWKRVADIAFPIAPDSAGSTEKAKKVPTPDAILAALDAFLESNPAPALVANLFDQFAARRPKK